MLRVQFKRLTEALDSHLEIACVPSRHIREPKLVKRLRIPGHCGSGVSEFKDRADDLALRLGETFGGILDPMNGLRIQRKRDFVGCHTSTIVLPHRIGEIGSPDTVANTRCRQGPALGVGISARRDMAAELPMRWAVPAGNR